MSFYKSLSDNLVNLSLTASVRFTASKSSTSICITGTDHEYEKIMN